MPSLRNEYVIYSGHWDHKGTQGENIFHGASDNASGTAGVLELARAFTELPKPAKRTVIFLFTTAEERGLLGAKYYVQHPLYPLSRTGDTDPAEGFYWRSDHVEFAMGGVPSLATSPGIDYVGQPADYGEQKRREYISNDYHKPTDQIKPGWDLTGAVEDLQVLLEWVIG